MYERHLHECAVVIKRDPYIFVKIGDEWHMGDLEEVTGTTVMLYDESTEVPELIKHFFEAMITTLDDVIGNAGLYLPDDEIVDSFLPDGDRE